MEALKRVCMSLCAIEAPEDGLTFLAESVQVEAIREDQEYGGMRVRLMAMLGNVRIPLQVDVGSGDAVVPPPETMDYPTATRLPPASAAVPFYMISMIAAFVDDHIEQLPRKGNGVVPLTAV